VIVLIPSYEPTQRLTDLVGSLKAAAPDVGVVVVDDGSGPAYSAIFDRVQQLGAELVTFAENRGKGAALKAGFRHTLTRHPGHDVVTADSDGQHTVDDILRVAFRLRREEDALILGVRAFHATTDQQSVPARSRFGNAVSAMLFKVAAGFAVSDTQTGLRGIPASALEWARTVKGDRFEYELEMLLAVKEAGMRVVELPIATVYLDHNASSHFRPVRDSLRVMRPMLRFGAASFAGFLIDTVVLQLVFWLSGSLLASVIAARVLSGSANFALNRRILGPDSPLLRSALKYAALAVALLVANYVWLSALTAAGLPLLPAKIVTEVSLYVVSFAVQRSIVFGRRRVPRRVSIRVASGGATQPTVRPPSAALLNPR
jgi:glycosyltransferase involved in cell wall biosynthesis